MFAELEDEEELPEPVDDNEDDDDFDDLVEDGEDSTDMRQCVGAQRSSWDDEFVLKRQFKALIPAFDPRPGTTNVNQITLT